MKFINLKMKNFRQFKDEAFIEFSEGSKNITLITGENGKGKTAIYRAIMYVLYGMKHIPQDDSREKNGLINFSTLEKDGRAEMSVILRFEHKGEVFEIMRKMFGNKMASRTDEQDDGVSLAIEDDFGNYKVIQTEPSEVNATIDKMLSAEIKDFFIFDGEKINTLVKTNDKYKKEVKTAITNLLQMDQIDKSLKIIDEIIRTERRMLDSKTAGQNHNEVFNRLEDSKDRKNRVLKLISEYEENISASNDLLSSFDVQLEKNNDISILQNKISEYESKLIIENNNVKNCNSNIQKLLIENAHVLLMQNEYIESLDYLQMNRKNISHSIPLDVVKFSIETNKCACCGNNLVVHAENIKILEKLRDELLENRHSLFQTELISYYIYASEDETHIENDLREQVKQIHSYYDRIETINLTIENLSMQIGSEANKSFKLSDVINAKNNEIENLGRSKERLRSARIEVDKINNEISDLEIEYNKLLQRVSQISKDIGILDIFSKSKGVMENISNEFNNEMRALLNEETTKMFKELIDPKDANLIKEVIINDKFEIVLIGLNGEDITQNISQGQGQIMSLSFILSLASVATTNEDLIEYPFFMDSPFNRLSSYNRKSLISKIPNMAKQWILLLTDSELSKSELSEFESNNKVGSVYHIVQVETYVAEIRKVNLMNAFEGGLI